MKKLAVAVIHGMGSQNIHFADEMIMELNERLSTQNLSPEDVCWKSIYWADILENREMEYLDSAKKYNLDFIRLRRFVLTAFGDATAYQKVLSEKNTTYEVIHARVRAKIKELYDELNKQDCPLVVMAHSLGGHIMSNYIWDVQVLNDADGDLSEFERMKYLAGIVTFGCNIPLFTFAYEKIVPIKFPGSGLCDNLKSKSRWLNFYDPDDVLGYPLKAIPAYANLVERDIAINVGGLLTSWNPACHNDYWADNDFTKPVAEFLGTFLKA